jgi:hypothetical protein
MTVELRHRCRQCRGRLAEPTDNLRRAFCTRFCFDSFYRSRCVVCEEGFRRRSSTQRTCIKKECKAELRRFPLTYRCPETHKTGNPPQNDKRVSEVPVFIESESALGGIPPTANCLREWRWGPEIDLELGLHDRDGKLLARLEHNRDRYRLTHPRTFPILSWSGLEEAKRGAESIALLQLPDPFAAKHERENARPHPMGPPLGLHLSQAVRDFKIRESKVPGDPGPIPDFLLHRTDSPPGEEHDSISKKEF